MTTQKAPKSNKPQAKKSPARIQRIPSTGFRCCGSWVSKDGGVMLAGVDNLYGPPIGVLGAGPSGSVKAMIWTSLSPEVTDSLANLAESEMSVGLCGTRLLEGEIEQEVWVHFQDEDLESLAEATVLIQSELAKSK